MIVIDYSATSIAAITSFREELNRSEEEIGNLVRHVVLSSIKNIKKMHKAEFGSEVVIAGDSQHYWRKDIFPGYKFKRKKQREDSDIPWDVVFRYKDECEKILKECFPYKVIKAYGAEADDILGVMAMRVAPSLIHSDGLFEEQEKCLLVTTDKDAKQCLTNPYTRLYNPRDKAFVKLETSSKEFLRRLILTGDSGDSIPNVFSDANSFVDGVRQKPCTEKKMAPILESKLMHEGTTDPAVQERIKMNSRLIAFQCIPENIVDSIIAAYNEPPLGSKMKIFEYLVANGMNLMLRDLDEF